jgi:hypothetical protein
MENTANVALLAVHGISPNMQKESKRKWRRRKETLGVLGAYTKRQLCISQLIQ